MQTTRDFHYESLHKREVFWAREAARIHWHRPFDRVVDVSRLPFARWFPGGQTNLCHNAVDRWAEAMPDAQALVWVSSEVDAERIYTWAELLRHVQTMAAVLQSQGVQAGDRVLIYMPMVPEAVFTMLACARIGAVHSVVFGGFASTSLAQRIDDATPRAIVTADAGSRGGKVVPYKPLLDDALTRCRHRVDSVLVLDRGLAPAPLSPGRDHDLARACTQHAEGDVPVVWLDSTAPSYVLYTSGTTGKPKGVQRDVGGYAVALAASMEYLFDSRPGDVFFCTSDIGWVVGHSYIVYGPLIGGQTTILYEGTPLRPDPGVLWRLASRFKVNTLFSAPTAIRVLKKQDAKWMQGHDLSALRAIYLAGEPLDEPSARWLSDRIGKPIIDNYWQTESGWPILSAQPGVSRTPTKYGSPSFPVFGFDVRIVDEITGADLGDEEKGVVAIVPPLPPGAMTTVWGDDQRFVQTYFTAVPGREVYSTFDWGRRDADGYFFILGRTDDVINVSGHRIGTRELEETINGDERVAECAVVGVQDELRGQVAVAFVVLKQPDLPDETLVKQLENDMMQRVQQHLGAFARPAAIRYVQALPKTRSGKVVRRAIVAVCEARDPGDLSTIEDQLALQFIKDAYT